MQVIGFQIIFMVFMVDYLLWIDLREKKYCARMLSFSKVEAL